MTTPFLSQSWYRIASLRPQLAAHAHIRLHRYRGRPWYVVTDPGNGRVHRLPHAALPIIAGMDGIRTVNDIWEAAATRLGDDAPSQDQVIQLLGQLHSQDLLRADVAPDTRELLERHTQTERRRLKQTLLNPLSLRIPLWAPDRFLTRTLPAFSWLFGWVGAALWLLALVPALVLVGQHWTELSTGVADRVLAADNLLLLVLILPATKLLHEFGHGYATKRFGGAVPEIGVMFLMLFPMPYVDATAAAGFRSKWRRIAVGGAGMAVELFIAALATFVWVAVEPGLLRSIAYNVMFAAGVTTVLFNGNPLMRYDGYYMLADLLELPNLGQRGTRYYAWLAQKYLLGHRDIPPSQTTRGERFWFVLYTPLATLYRLTVTFGIALFLAEKYFVAGVLLAAWNMVGAVITPTAKAIWFVLTSPALQRCRTRATAVTACGTALAVAVLLWLPAPLHTNVEGVVWLPDTATIRAGTDGFVTRLLATPGTQIAAGTAIAQSQEPTLAARHDTLAARVTELRAQLASEDFSHLVDALVTRTELGQAEAELADTATRVTHLVATTADAGTLALPSATDLPGRFLREGDVIGYVLPPPGARTIRAAVPQDDIDLLRTHTRRVEIMLAGQTFPSTILREIPSGRDQLPSRAPRHHRRRRRPHRPARPARPAHDPPHLPGRLRPPRHRRCLRGPRANPPRPRLGTPRPPTLPPPPPTPAQPTPSMNSLSLRERVGVRETTRAVPNQA